MNQLHRQILMGDGLDKIKEIPNETIDIIISSPPYFNLRDYGEEGQWGNESNFNEYLDKLDKLMFELKRVLKKTGTCWINLGDSYGSHRSNEDQLSTIAKVGGKQEQEIIKEYEKSRLAIPERFYVRCIDNGWIARNHIVWYKENAMPSSIKDRFTNKWESLFFFSKEKRYYSNLSEVREKPKYQTKPFNRRVRENITGLAKAKMGDKSWTATEEEKSQYNRDGTRKESKLKIGEGKPENQIKLRERMDEAREFMSHDNPLGSPFGKNPGDVWLINSRPFPEAHFATFPIDLPLRILKFACPKQVCSKCGIPRFPIYKKNVEHGRVNDRPDARVRPDSLERPPSTWNYLELEIESWTKCNCNADFHSGIVLDPFFGAGTVAVAAEQLGLDWVGIELKEEYTQIARKRLKPFTFKRLDEFL